jgi:hypothetical protein
LPEASRFAQLEELDWAFGTMERKIKANIWLLYTLRIFQIIVECVDANFGFSRYAERLGKPILWRVIRSSTEPTYIDSVLLSTKRKIEAVQPTFFLISVPFRNLYSAFRSAQWVKKSSQIKVSMGGGFRIQNFSLYASCFNFSITLL